MNRHVENARNAAINGAFWGVFLEGLQYFTDNHTLTHADLAGGIIAAVGSAVTYFALEEGSQYIARRKSRRSNRNFLQP